MKQVLFGDVSSEGGSYNANDHKALLRMAGLVVASSLVTWLIGVVPGLDLGAHKETVLPVVLFLLEAARRWLGSRLPAQPQG